MDNATIANPTLTTALITNTSYTLQVTDSTGCMGFDTINLIYDTTALVTVTTTNNECPGTGTATAHVACGDPTTYTYLWNDPNNQTTATAVGLFFGAYTVQVTDSDGIVYTVNTTIQPKNPKAGYHFTNPVITGNVLWNSTLDSTIKVKGEVVVERGGVLTINSSNVEFAYDLINDVGVLYPRARITVQQGGKLVVINSTLTGCGDTKWDGIEVWGDATTASRTTGATGSQGSVVLNGATIKNAVTGVYCNRSNLKNVDFRNNQGAKLTVTNSDFINNLRAVVFEPYPYNSGNSITNNCSFSFDSTQIFSNLDLATYPEIIYVQAKDYKGLTIIGNNNFINPNRLNNMIGIKAENAEFTSTLNDFNNLTTGIDASGINSLQAISITENTFNQCNKGIYAKGITGMATDKNTFTIPTNPTDTTYGIYLLDCNMYSVQENTFNGTPAGNIVGLYIYNTDVANNTQTNQVYRNTFNNLGYASFGNGVNGNAGDPAKGLTFKCNTYVGNDFDILTTVAPGISIQQGASGSSSTPAGNKFTDACGAVTDGELLNAAVVGTPPNSYQYWYHNTLTYIPDAGCYTPSQVQPNDAGVAFEASGTGESCPTNFGGCGPFCRESIRQVQLANSSAINQLTTTLDGGNSATLTTTITAGATSAGQLKNLLMQNSPLSSAVLTTLINSNYSAGIIKDVLLQNSPLSNQVLYALLTRQPQLSSGIVKDILQKSAPLASEIMVLALANNYPGGITNQITNNQQNAPLPPSVTQLTEGYIGELTRENSLLTNRLVRSFLHDIEDEYRFDSISVLLKTGGIIPPCRACVVEADIKAKNYTGALQEIVVMEQAGETPEFTNLQRTLIDMENMPDKLMSVMTDSTLKSTVEAIAVQTNKKGSINARNLLDMAFKQKVMETYHFPQNNGNSLRIINPNTDEESDNKSSLINHIEGNDLFNLYPNPNQGTFTLLYSTQEKENTYLNIIDFTGKTVLQQTLSPKQGKETITMTHLPSGIYFVRISSKEGKLLYTNKLSIVK